jgi:lysophospholipase L1-like esterase
MRRIPVLLSLSLTFAACGGSSPTGPGPTPTPTPAGETYSVEVTVFDDENHNGRNDGGESGWIPEVDVEIAGKVGRTERRTGRAVVNGVPRGTFPVTLRANSLPPYYSAGAPLTIDSPPPAGAAYRAPVVVSIGANTPGVYMASGDSISQGPSANMPNGYRLTLQSMLGDYYGRATVTYRGGGGGTTSDALLRPLETDIDGIRPAATFIQWGVNDWNDLTCQRDPAAPLCPMRANYKRMVQIVRQAQSLPFLATFTPPNVAAGGQSPPERLVWAKAANEMIRAIAKEEKVVLVDLEATFLKQSNLPSLYLDHVHPNDAGYDLIAQTYFQALTHGVVASSFSAMPLVFDQPATF